MAIVSNSSVIMKGHRYSSYDLSTLLSESMKDGGFQNKDIDLWLSHQMDPNVALERLKNDASLARQLLACEGPILYCGGMSDQTDDKGRTLGVVLRDVELDASGHKVYVKGGKVYRSSDNSYVGNVNNKNLGLHHGKEYEGDNVYGAFLMDLRSRYIEYLEAAGLNETSVRPGQVVCDFMSFRDALRLDDQYQNHSVVFKNGDGYRKVVKKGDAGRENISDVTMSEEEGDRFIHTDRYRMTREQARRAYYASKDGTTGYNQREDSTGVIFQTFECPFGLDSWSVVRVGSAAEMSYMYERGLRGDVDWTVYLKSLRDRGLLRNIGEADIANLSNRLQSQFAWMRDRIINDYSVLQEMPVVADLYLIPDSSFGRSIYDSVYAPSPAHILARYINNPDLLLVPSVNMVARALEMQDHNETLCFHEDVSPADRTVSIIIDGSDTIGGRVPGTRAVTSQKVIYMKDAQGHVMFDRNNRPIIERTVKQPEIQFKPKDEIEEDYRRFSARLDVILQHLSSNTKVEFVTGTGIGTPMMVRRYVEEHGGAVNEWNYFNSGRDNVIKAVNPDSRFSALRMPGFADVVPVLVGRVGSSSVLTTPGDESTEHIVTSLDFSKGRLNVAGYISCSVAAAADNERVLRRGSLAVAEGIPVIHIQENRSEEEQKYDLHVSSMDAFSTLVGERIFEDSLFEGEPRVTWDVPSVAAANATSVANKDGEVIPAVAFLYDAGVPVNGYVFHSAYSVYAAMMMRTAGVADSSMYRALADNEQSVQYITSVLNNLKVTEHQREVCLRNAVHCLAVSSSVFANLLDATGDLPNVAVSSFGGTELFVSPKGEGRNLFGLVMDSERKFIRQDRQVKREKAEMEAQALAEENARLIRRAGMQHAVGIKEASGLPDGRAESEGAIWLIGTNRPGQLVDSQERQSVILWEQSNSSEVLNREMASRAKLDDGAGGLVDNNAIFLFPTDLSALTGKRHVKNDPNERNLTGVTRINPSTGEEFVCAYGIPVKKNSETYEENNDYGTPSSFFSERDSATLVNGIINADALARTQAMRQDMSLCFSVYPGRNGSLSNDDISRVFNNLKWDYPVKREVVFRSAKQGTIVACCSGDVANMLRFAIGNSENGILRSGSLVFCLNKAGNICLDDQRRKPVTDLAVDELPGLYDALMEFGIIDGSGFTSDYRRFISPLAGVRMPVVTGKAVYNRKDREMQYGASELKKQWVENPHGSALLKGLVKRYESVLEQSSLMPLNCICFPEKDYNNISDSVVRSMIGLSENDPVTDEQRSQVLESKFLSDFNFTLSLVNAVAVAADLPMKFPIDKNGHLNLGPGVPEHLRILAERKLDAFLGEFDGVKYHNGSLPYIERTPHLATGSDMMLDGHDINLRPNDLMMAFGPYDFSQVSTDWRGPIHEMSFVLDDGSVFKLHNTNLAKNMKVEEINQYLRYQKNPVSRFVVKTNAPERTSQFLSVLKEYIARAKEIKVETRTVTENELRRLEDSRRSSLRGLLGEYDAVSTVKRMVNDGIASLMRGQEDGVPEYLVNMLRAEGVNAEMVKSDISPEEMVKNFCSNPSYHDVLVSDVRKMAESACRSMLLYGWIEGKNSALDKAVFDYSVSRGVKPSFTVDFLTDEFIDRYDTAQFTRDDIRKAVVEVVVNGVHGSSNDMVYYNVSNFMSDYLKENGYESLHDVLNEYMRGFFKAWSPNDNVEPVITEACAPYVRGGAPSDCLFPSTERFDEYVMASMSSKFEKQVASLSETVFGKIEGQMSFIVQCACSDLAAGRSCDSYAPSLVAAWKLYAGSNNLAMLPEYITDADDKADACSNVIGVWQSYVCDRLAEQWNRYCCRSNSQKEKELITGDMLFDPENDFDSQFIYEVKESLDNADDVYGLDCYVNLLSSNSDQMAFDSHDVAARGDVTALDAPNRFDGSDVESSYYGKEDAKDSFAGYVQFRYTLPDGRKSDWVTISDKSDRELAVDLIYSKIHRVYRSDLRAVPAPNVLEAEVRSLAIRHAGSLFRDIVTHREDVKTKQSVGESKAELPESSVKESSEAVSTVERVVNVDYSKNQNAVLSNFAIRPFHYPVDKMKRNKSMGV